MSNRLAQLKGQLQLYLNKEDEIAPSDEAVKTILQEFVDTPITYEVLKKTQLGILVNKVKKASENEEIIELARTVIGNWKKIVLPDHPVYPKSPASATKKVSISESPSASTPPPSSKSLNIRTENDQADSPSGERTLSRSNSATNFGGDSSPIALSHIEAYSTKVMPKVTLVNATGDSTRDKCAELIFNALIMDDVETVERDGALSLARRIESALFREFNCTDAKYKAKFRSKVFNLKEKSNTGLRLRILFGEVSPERFIEMTPQDMASEDRKEKDALIHKENLMEAQVAAPAQSETDQFRCGKCKQRRTKYYQLQTRSADEPMTTYVTCINCGHRWKFC